MNGFSIGCLPRNVNIIKELAFKRLVNFRWGLNLDELVVFNRGGSRRIRILDIKAITPPSFLGIDRRMA